MLSSPKPFKFGMATHLLGWVSESWGAADASATEGAAGVSEGGDGPADRVALPLDRSADDESLHRPAPIAEKERLLARKKNYEYDTI